MTSLIEWLLDLENIRLRRDAPLILTWDNPFEAWMWFGFGMVSLAWIGLVYRREHASVVRRTVLAAIRCAVVAFVAAVLCRPSLVLQQDRVEPSHVAILLDTSMSMAATDVYSDESLTQFLLTGAGLTDAEMLARQSRLGLIQAALTREEAAPLQALLSRNEVQLCTFARAVESQGFFSSASSLPDLSGAVGAATADGTSTDLAGAISQVVARAQGRRLAAIILASDGQTTHPTSLKDALDLVRDRRIPIFPLRIGSPERPWDVEVASPRSQESVFVDDVLAVEAQLSGYGLAEAMPVNVRLIDEHTEEVVASERITLEPPQDSTRVELRTKPRRPGRVRYRIEADPIPGEKSTENNAERVDVTVLDNRLRVLYVDGYPRYEYRYLKNSLVREQTMDLSVLLIEADERFVQEGTDPIRRFPETPEELNRYDVVLFGDVDPRTGWLTQAQMNMLLDFVGNEGGGFGLIAGERAAPHRFVGTPLEKLIPVRIDPSFFGHYDTPLRSGFRAELTSEGRRSPLFRFVADREANAQILEGLPELYWIARSLGPKPGASVLAVHPTLQSFEGPLPLVVMGRYGAGKLFFQATDDTWRWRRHAGELLHDTYWVQVVRALMRGPRVAQDRRFVLRTDRRVYRYGSSVRTQIKVFDSRLLGEQRDTIEIDVAQAPSHPNPSSIDTGAADPASAGVPPIFRGRISVRRLGPGSNVFEGTWVPPRPGTYVFEASELTPRTGERRVSLLVRVDRPDLEARRPQADHGALARIAHASGGQLVELDQLTPVFSAIRDRSVRIPDDIVEPLWDSKLALVLFVLMISMEWILRKAFGLL